MTQVLENILIEGLVDGMPRSDDQIGGLQESDAELVRLPGTGDLLAITTDSIAEEIEMGLYEDPYLIGWMAVIVNASDLAAVGASPVGVLLSETLPIDLPDADRARLQTGIRDACAACRLPVLGGDTNVARHFQVGATAVGLVRGGVPLTRVGSRPGDVVFSTGLLGLGNCYALTRLNAHLAQSAPRISYRPEPRLREGAVVRAFATACIDTSDGPLAAIDQLQRLNDVGFNLNVDEAIHPAARQLAESAGIPSWMMLAGLHGEFELLFTVPRERIDGILYGAESNGWRFVRVGEVVAERGVRIDDNDCRLSLDTGGIRNLFSEPTADVEPIIGRLKKMVKPCTQ